MCVNIKHVLAVGVVVAGFTTSGSTLAQMNLSGFYVGGGVGQSKIDIDNTAIDVAVRSVPGITSSATTSDERDTGWKLFAGYQFHPNFAAELSYANLGKFNTVTRTTPPATFNGEFKIDNTWSADILGIWPVGNNFSLFGRLGLLYAETKVSVSGTGPGGVASVSSKDNDWNYKFGFGVGYEFTPNIGVRGEWERYRVPDGTGGHGDADLWSLSLRF